MGQVSGASSDPHRTKALHYSTALRRSATAPHFLAFQAQLQVPKLYFHFFLAIFIPSRSPLSMVKSPHSMALSKLPMVLGGAVKLASGFGGAWA